VGENLLKAVEILGLGMLAIFLVMAVIYGFVLLFNLLSAKAAENREIKEAAKAAVRAAIRNDQIKLN
jgi:hypothetical protein